MPLPDRLGYADLYEVAPSSAIDRSTLRPLNEWMEFLENPETIMVTATGGSTRSLADWMAMVDEVVGGPGPTVVSFDPADNAIEVDSAADLVVTFSPNVTLGTGNVMLKRTSDNATIETWDVVTDAGSGPGQVEISGATQLTMHLTTSVVSGTEYYVVWDEGVVEDAVGNPVAAQSSTTAWSFTTAGIVFTGSISLSEFSLLEAFGFFSVGEGSGSYTYSFGSGSEHGSTFGISGDELVLLATLDYDVKNTYALVVIADNGIQPLQLNLTVNVILSVYVGPGDIVAGADRWFGLRGYSAAVAGPGTQKAVKVRRSIDDATQDILIRTDGYLDVASATSFAAGGSLFVETWYDQAGGNKHATQATTTVQPQLLLSGGPSNLPIILFNGSQNLLSTTAGTIAQPWSVAAIAMRSGANATQYIIGKAGAFAIGFTATQGRIATPTANSNTTLASGVLYGLQYHANSPSCFISKDGVAGTTVNTGSTGFSASIGIGASSDAASKLTGQIYEVGVWPGFTAPQIANMNANQHAIGEGW